MWLKSYEVERDGTGKVYQFVSEGPKGRIAKLVKYSPMQPSRIVHLGFGDLDQVTGKMDDHARPDNGDSEQVLSTVVQTVLIFTTLYPEAIIYAKGSTPARTRLYQMGISKHLAEIKEEFDVYGLFGEGWEPFMCDRPYQAFMAERTLEKQKELKNTKNKR
jgi:hypothetical protein